MSANDDQVGGDHYKAEFQHWDFVEENGIGYLEGCATKYATRWRHKAGVEDVKKAIHYVEKLMEMHALGRREARGIAPVEAIRRFADANHLSSLEERIVYALARWSNATDLRVARTRLSFLLEDAKHVALQSVDGGGQAP